MRTKAVNLVCLNREEAIYIYILFFFFMMSKLIATLGKKKNDSHILAKQWQGVGWCCQGLSWLWCGTLASPLGLNVKVLCQVSGEDSNTLGAHSCTWMEFIWVRAGWECGIGHALGQAGGTSSQPGRGNLSLANSMGQGHCRTVPREA